MVPDEEDYARATWHSLSSAEASRSREPLAIFNQSEPFSRHSYGATRCCLGRMIDAKSAVPARVDGAGRGDAREGAIEGKHIVGGAKWIRTNVNAMPSAIR